MSSRFFSLLLAVCLSCVGFTAAAKPAMAAPVASTEGSSLYAGEAGAWLAAEDDSPFPPSTPLDRDGAVDQPELFDASRLATGPADTAPRPPGLGAIDPAGPYLQGLRRPPRGRLPA